ncbi:MAG: hypothetical protein MUF64_18845 [Polyangiaceae bacterium]|jgi:type IV pilus assembly protein PilB|nr:hypothetical protein [Polyangiaceae bacterium]
MTPVRPRLGQLLVEAGIVSPEQLAAALLRQKADPRRLGELLVEAGALDEVQLTQVLSQQLNAPWVSLYHVAFSRHLLNLIPREIAEQFCLIPIYVRNVRGQGNTLYVAMDDPTNERALQACARASRLPARAMIAPPSDIRDALRVYYGAAPRASEPSVVEELGEEDEIQAEPEVLEAQDEVPAPCEVSLAQIEIVVEPPAPSPVTPPAPPPAPPASPPAPLAVALPLETDAPFEGLEAMPPSSVAREEPPPPRMITVTLLDGTTVTLPARAPRGPRRPTPAPAGDPPARPPAPSAPEDQLTARDLISALRAVSHGADASEILGDNAGWEALFAALLSLLLKKHVIADWEFVEEYKRI